MNKQTPTLQDLQSQSDLREAAEASLAESKEIFRILVDAIEDYAIFALDPNGHILTWNLGGQRLKGYTAKEIIGSHFSRFYTKRDIDRNHPANELKIAREIGKYEEEGWRVKKDGSVFWANVVITAMKNEEGELTGFVKVTRDLTERRKAERALFESEEKIRLAYSELEKRVQERTKELSEAKINAENAVRVRDQFFSMASHELKTPLSSLKLQTQIRKRNVLRGNLSDFAPEHLLELCEDDERQVDRLAVLVDNMLDVSRLTSGNFNLNLKTFDIKSLIEDVVKRLAPVLKETGNTCTIPHADSVVGRWDWHRLSQVLTNLLTNAGRYAPNTPVEVSVWKREKDLQIIVKDQGPGIPPEDRENIFHPFKRMKRENATGGMGLGLYISNEIIIAHRGFVYIESEPGQGATFIVELPLETDAG